MAAPNIVNVTSIIGRTAIQNVTTSATDIVTNASNSNSVVKINNLVVSNVDGSAVAEITASLFRGGVDYRLASTIAVPADSSLVVLDKSTSIYLEEGDSIRLVANAALDLQAVCSYEVIS